LKESPDFKLSHPGKTFELWCAEIDGLYESWCEDRKKCGESTDLDEFLDYDWLNDSDNN